MNSSNHSSVVSAPQFFPSAEDRAHCPDSLDTHSHQPLYKSEVISFLHTCNTNADPTPPVSC